jgi:hypothetical protein
MRDFLRASLFSSPKNATVIETSLATEPKEGGVGLWFLLVRLGFVASEPGRHLAKC